MTAAPHARARQTTLVVAVAVAMTVAGGLGVFLLLTSSSHPCVPGSVVAVENHTLTPQVLVNSPFLGSGTGTYLGVSPSNLSPSGPIVGAENGSVWGHFEDFRSTIREGVHQDTSNACDGQFFVSQTDNLSGGTQSLGSGLRNDSSEQEWVGDNGTGYSLVYLNNSFTSATTSVSTCGLDRETLGLTSDHFSIRLPFSTEGHPENVTVEVNALVSLAYTFPADGGTWLIDNLSAPGGPGGGWAFSFLGPCT